MKKVIKVEEEKYFKNISKGIEYITELIAKLKDAKVNVIPEMRYLNSMTLWEYLLML